MKTPETYEKGKIDEHLKALGAYNAKPATWGYGSSGECDRLVCLDGLFIGIEVKREGKEPTPRQYQRLRAIAAAGGLAVWGTAAKVIREIDKWRYARLSSPVRNGDVQQRKQRVNKHKAKHKHQQHVDDGLERLGHGQHGEDAGHRPPDQPSDDQKHDERDQGFDHNFQRG